MLKQSTGELIENIEFINLLYRLGVSYHFEAEIKEQLSHIFIALPDNINDNNYDLYTSALIFQVLRQHGYKMPYDVFKKFKDNNGEFKKSINDDVKGLLGLYEATFLSVHGEDILDEALVFTKRRLEILAAKSSPHLANRIRNALLRPFHHGIERIETRQYISFYAEEESPNQTPLKFAKLDFNRLQLLYKQELALVSKWWKDLNLVEKLPYVRDRIVKIYIWAIGAHFEPQYALVRVMITKYTKMVSVVDDIYDAYGTLDELQQFTIAVQRWWKDLNLVEELPYVRDRIVEIYLWAIGAHFEPQYALARVMITKYTKMVSVVDDTYDAYGTLDELQQFTIAVQRCNIDAIDQLPEYMKVLYRALLNLFAEIENDEIEGRSQRTAYAKETELVRAYFVEAKWFNEGYVPPFEEYISNGLVSSTYSVLPAASFIGLENVVGSKEYEWVKENPKIVNASKLISRLMDDVTTHEHEQERGHCASGIECYIQEYGVSQKEAIDEIQKMCANAWKDMNEACMKPIEVSTTLLKYYVNLARFVDFVYKYSDSYTFPTILKDDIKSLFLKCGGYHI
ncbi:hypothetical protein JCGZ_10983 [Jatropha curcas]|uniref:Uncharacterized protein n=1 Tax=Jatropha curcas TaxID=180498 RepID=A0A067KGV5_JATCU|nr:hypothetical protein JCGZ_10983 [Jatropha curcas]